MVTGIRRGGDGGWIVATDKGDVACEHVVNAGGLWAREVGRMVGLELPILAMEHMYLITEDMPEVAEINRQTGTEVVHAVDFDGELYLRQERGGMLMGTYEKACVPWSERQTPWNFGHELLQPDIDRIAPSLEVGFEHFPAFQNAGIKQIINGPFTFAPDGNPLIGPIRGLPGMWSACGVMAGFSQGGGVGLALANWITGGDPGFDVWAMDVARYGDWATMSYTNPKVQENYARRFSIRFPNEELSAARPYRTTPIYDRLIGLGAQMGDSWGLEAPLWFSPDGTRDAFSWRRSTDFAHVAEEVRACRENVGLMEISGFSKFLVRGAGAGAFLDRVLACKLPKPGRMTLAPMLKHDGKLQGDLTVACLSDEEYYLAGSGMAEVFYARWLEEHMPDDGSVTLEVVGLGLVGLSIAGPKSRDLLQRVTPTEVSNATFRFMDIGHMDVGFAPCMVGRVSFTGDLGYEIWMKPEYQRHVFERLLEAGADLGLKPFGLRALNAMRLEKNFGGWAREYRPVYGPLEAGLDRFVAYDKPADFIGKAAARQERETGGALRLLSFAVDAQDADVIGDEPIWHDGNVVGWVTSGGYAHHAGASMAMGYVDKAVADSEGPWAIELLGERRDAARSASRSSMPTWNGCGGDSRLAMLAFALMAKPAFEGRVLVGGGGLGGPGGIPGQSVRAHARQAAAVGRAEIVHFAGAEIEADDRAQKPPKRLGHLVQPHHPRGEGLWIDHGKDEKPHRPQRQHRARDSVDAVDHPVEQSGAGMLELVAMGVERGALRSR